MLTLEHSLAKVLEQMSMINFMNYSLSTAAEGFVPSHIPLKKNKHLNLPFQPSNEHSGLISLRMDWLNLLAFQGTLKSLLQHHSSKASIL